MNITSPCINVCKLDSRDICTGCYRTRDEIARWTQMTEAERWQIISICRMRPDMTDQSNRSEPNCNPALISETIESINNKPPAWQ
jgi:uncharacterized protein